MSLHELLESKDVFIKEHDMYIKFKCNKPKFLGKFIIQYDIKA